MPVHTDFIRNFLRRMEERRLVAYVPCRRRNFTGHEDPALCGEVIGASGVTVGAGLDLGQQSDLDLRRMGLPPALMARLRPYLGQQRQAAVAALTAAPLELSDAECDAVDAAVHGDYIRRAAERYNREAARAFTDCPPEAQAVVVSLFYQLGAPTRYPSTWEHLCRTDWSAAAHELQTGFSRYPARRRAEGELLKEVA